MIKLQLNNTGGDFFNSISELFILAHLPVLACHGVGPRDISQFRHFRSKK
jgi:hypothetical protein